MEPLPVLQRWFIDAPTEDVKESPYSCAGGLRWLVKRYPATRRAVKEACKRAGEHGEAVLNEL